MKPGSSINYQAQIAWNFVDGIGESKKHNREDSWYKGENGHKVSDKIHSLKQKDQFMRLTKDILNHQKELGIRPDLHTLTKDILHSYVNDMVERGLKYNAISTYMSHMNKLHIAVNKIPDNAPQKIKDAREPLFTPKDVKEARALAKEQALSSIHVNRAYTNVEAIGIHMKDDLALSFQLQKDYGLRVAAATKISPEQLKDNNKFEFANKGGKLQTIRLDPQLHQQLKVATSQGRGMNISYNEYLKDFKQAVKLSGQEYHGTHGLRYTYAQTTLQDLRDKGFSDKDAKEIVSNDLGHQRLDITDHYLFSA